MMNLKQSNLLPLLKGQKNLHFIFTSMRLEYGRNEGNSNKTRSQSKIVIRF